MSDHDDSKQTLEHVSKLKPCRVQGLGTPSATMWRLQLEMDSRALAHRVASIDEFSPRAWVVVGIFSLQKEHESASLFFK